MKTWRAAADALITFVLVLVVSAVASLLWSLARHGTGAVDWEASFRLAIIFAIILPWLRVRERRAAKQ